MSVTINKVVPGAKNGMLELTWMAESRSLIGTTEIPGVKHNPIILGFWKAIGITWGTTDEIPWCAAFTGAMLKKAGMPYLSSGMARAYVNYVKQLKKGKVLKSPCYGCIVVMWTGSIKGTQGHIGFCAGVQSGKPDNLMILAGNQSNRVGIDPFSKSKVLAYIWPSVAPTQARYELPVLEYKGKGVATTR
jgi:uncharacterized protein (TIGR02594 family)